MTQLSVSFGAFGASLLCATALAGPDWNEGGADAGESVGTQRVVSSSGGLTSANSTRGSTSLGLLGNGDLVDLIELEINDPLSFKFTPNLIGPGFDARLFLFRGGGSTSQPIGEPLLCVDNANAGSNLPAFDNTGDHPMSVRFAQMQESFTPGRYLIAIAGTGMQPVGASDNDPVFYMTSTGIGPRRSASPQWVWSTPSGATAGQWNFGTGGVEFIEGDACADAEYVYGASERPVNNVTATDTAGLIDQCAQTGRDVWYRLFLDCGGTVRVSTCGTVNFDSVITVYTGTCDALVHVACNDDSAGCAGSSSSVEFSGDPCAGGEYLVRVGSWTTTPGGSGTIKFDCITPPPSADLNGDGTVNAVDLGILLGQWQ